MNAVPKVLHRTAQPIRVSEFVEALQAICPPRFPKARSPNSRPVGIAVSGGVDSMALAYLCSQAHRVKFRLSVADNPVGSFRCLIIDHRIREESTNEALAAKLVLRDLGLRVDISAIPWQQILRTTGHAHPKELPNIETIARRQRYRRLGIMCDSANMDSLLMAHHQEDQYETILMRLLSGHGKAGLLGMRAAADIPECHDMYRVWRSGFLDDQKKEHPMIDYRPTKKERRIALRQMREEMDPEIISRELQNSTGAGAFGEEEFDAYVPKSKWLLPAAPPEVEDGGVMIYRPLLEFSKDRLIATCEANNIAWFEDATNRDPTMTLRNAVRHMYKNHTLPVALQKPAILAMSSRLRNQADLDEAEANRLLKRTVIRDFEPVVGTVVVQLPSFRIPRLRRGQGNEVKRMKRLEHYRKIAAILVKKLIAIVTPEIQGSFATNLQNTVLRLFPSLRDRPAAFPKEPKSFVNSSVHFIPIRKSKHPKEPLKWYLTREPYQSHRPTPLRDWACLQLRMRWRRRPEQWRWPRFRTWRFWDGRFWVCITNRTPVHAFVAPFDIKHAKAFRDSLSDDRARDELMALMKLHAPGKVRYTLPAIYMAGDYVAAIANHARIAERDKKEEISENQHIREWIGKDPVRKQEFVDAVLKEREKGLAKPPFVSWKSVEWLKISKAKEKVLVALPTLGIERPGLSKWMKYEFRYRKVDKRILEQSVSDETELAYLQNARALARVRGIKGWKERLSKQRRKPLGQGRRRSRRAKSS